MKLPRVAAVLLVVALTGCSATGALEVGGTGIEACIPAEDGDLLAIVVPIQNSSDSDATIIDASLNTVSATFGDAYLLGEFGDASDDTLANLASGPAENVTGLEGAPLANGMTVPAHSRGQLALTFTPTAAGAGIEGITLEYDGGDITSTPRVTVVTGDCN
jgi:hypothetical protein